MNKEERERFLLDLYEWQVEKGHSRGGQINKDLNNIDDDYRKKREIIRYWEERGYVQVVAEAIGFVVVRLTSYGIDFVENNLR